ncbi:amidohydrolase [Frigidibacter mobilis]|uniref:Hydrolase n=1 Tax=Frigidibacter mobilis TaxID=1335048 RepID=A0A159Z3U0_9RHOB|nr:amidohydrolase [Frigidibacter mobilis]AMY68874.1 hydrolase [Frigidibacter mobilis]
MIPQGWLDSILPEMIGIRHDLHAHPEIGMEEVRTSGIVAAELTRMGLPFEQGIGGTGVVAAIHGTRPGPTIGLRADMDALAITEETGLPYASTNGLMHACGHDGHTTMLLTAARWLAENRDFPGTVHLIFQPAEEGRGGAKAMLRDGLFKRFPCDMIFGLHNTPGMPAGEFGLREGAMMAGAGKWEVTFRGKGGHGGVTPHLTQDISYASAHFVLALQGIVGRHVPPLEPAVLSVGHIGGGNPEAYNVVPSRLLLRGTMRCFSEETANILTDQLEIAARAAAALTGCKVEVEAAYDMPPLINDPRCYALALAAAQAVAGRGQVEPELGRTTGSEDFACMMREVPGAFMRIGNGRAADGSFHAVHTPHYDFNDEIIGPGARYWVTLVHQALDAGATASV